MLTEKDRTRTIWLVAGYVALQLAADIAAVKMITFGPWVIPAGTLVFAITFTFRDLIHENLGYRGAVNAVWAAAAANVILSAYIMLAMVMKPAVWWTGQEAFATTLALIPRITVASILAEIASELVDTTIYETLLRRKAAPWIRVAGSNLFGIVVDSVTFTALAFSFVMPFNALTAIVAGQIVFKLIVTVFTLPAAKWFRRK